MTKLNIFEELQMHMYNDMNYKYADINNLISPITMYAKELFNSLDIEECLNLFRNISSSDKIYNFTDEEIQNENIIELFTYNFIKIDYLDILNRSYNDLSLGERKIFTELLFIFDYSINTDSNDILLLLDEPDNTLHPNWQKRYLNELLRTLSNPDFSNKVFNIIITSHSPYILSDLPKENVIFLKNGKQEYPFKENEQTFGANIHTLLSHGFFMEDGLMGEFAKKKINEIFDYLKNDIPLKTIEEKNVKNIIKLIGADFLKEKLLHMYDLKFPKSSEEKIEELEKEIERLRNA